MSAALDLAIEGIGLCAPGLPDWTVAAAALRGTGHHVDEPAAAIPKVTLLSPNEQRRAPQSVLLAAAAAEQACRMAGRAPCELPNVFASSYGDLAINDYLCAVLARAPRELSPTKFHNSVHNAPAGYWTIAAGCTASSTALSAGRATFAAGLLETATIACAEATPVLCVAVDVAASGPLAGMIDCDAAFAVALVLAPPAGAHARRLRLQLRDGDAAQLAPLPAALHALRERNPAAVGLPLLAALARREPATFDFALHDDKDLPPSTLHLEIAF
ncbi:MAG: beta-ketoacyl synthase chain length factor [Rudaea sp.]|uniref:beta-ketoacyl synthase chain length factor n=1 Tax=Rudaea sp. TaxID=2136325 RepID=UPI0039E69E0F